MANAEAASFLESLIQQGNATDPGFTVYDGDLRMCESVPSTVDASSCTVVWDGHTRGNVTFDTQGQTYAAVNGSLSSSSALPSSSTPAVSSFSAVSSSSAAAAVSAAPSLSFTTISSASLIVSQSASSSSSSSSAAASSFSTASVSGTASVTVTSAATRTITLITSSTAAPQNNVATDSDSESDSEESDDESDDELDLDGSTLIVFHHHDKRGVVLPETQMRLALQGYATVNLDGLYGIEDIGMPRKCLYALNWPCDMYACLLFLGGHEHTADCILASRTPSARILRSSRSRSGSSECLWLLC